MTSRVADLTLEQLEAMIETIVVRKIGEVRKVGEVSHIRRIPGYQPDSRSYEEILASIDRNMWTPPPGAKSSLELLREDRDR
jgi:hypothetical protein